MIITFGVNAKELNGLVYSKKEKVCSQLEIWLGKGKVILIAYIHAYILCTLFRDFNTFYGCLRMESSI